MASYFNTATKRETRKALVQSIITALQDNGVEFDTVVGRGISGAAIAPIIAYEMDKHVYIARKEEARSHSSDKYAGDIAGNFIVIDDLVATGNTLDEMLRNVDNTLHSMRTSSECVGMIIYQDRRNCFDALNLRRKIHDNNFRNVFNSHTTTVITLDGGTLCSVDKSSHAYQRQHYSSPLIRDYPSEMSAPSFKLPSDAMIVDSLSLLDDGMESPNDPSLCACPPDQQAESLTISTFVSDQRLLTWQGDMINKQSGFSLPQRTALQHARYMN